MAYQALYRKWRPMVFDDVIGQKHITETIKNEILNGKISHAYLFTGTRGTGKTSTAKIFSRAVNCLNPQNGNPCNECEICRGILSERILDVIEIDAASNTGVDNIRDIIDQTKYAPTESKCRVYIIDEVHMLSAGAFNALLKTLEEPTPGVIFVLATTEIHKVPATIMSRCQRFDFKTINVNEIAERIEYILKNEKISAEREAVMYVSQLGDGSMRDSLSILDQCLAFKPNNLTYADVVDTVGAIDDTFLYDIACRVSDGDAAGAVKIFEKCIADGKNTDYFAQGLLEVYRSLLLFKVSGNSDYTGLKAANTENTSKKYTTEKLMYCIDIITKLLNDIKLSSSPKVYTEMALIKMASPELDESNGALLARISELEEKFKSGKIPPYTQTQEKNTEKDEADDIPPWEDAPLAYEEYSVPETEVIEEYEAEREIGEKSGAQAVCDNWGELENAVMSGGAITLYMALRKARPMANGDKLRLVFEDAEARDACAKAENKAKLEECISTVFNIKLETEYLTKNQVISEAGGAKGDFFGKIEQFSKDFPENIEMYEN